MTENLHNNPEEVKEFINKFSDNSDLELSAIITRYTGYRPEAVEAALFVSVEKGFLSYDTKELLWQQIESSFKALNKNIKYYRWESSNAFVKYLSGYSDEEIYTIIDDPDNIAIDVYHALLVTARERELISDKDFSRYYEEAKLSLVSDEEIDRRIISDVFRLVVNADVFKDEVKLEAESEKYWKCPVCNENVGMEYGVCWKCEASVPEVIVHPGPEEMRKELPLNMPSSPVKIGFRLIVTGVIIFVVDYFRHYNYSSYPTTHLGGYIISGFFVLIGTGFILFPVFTGKDKE
jgi:hypothetical protein